MNAKLITITCIICKKKWQVMSAEEDSYNYCDECYADLARDEREIIGGSE